MADQRDQFHFPIGRWLVLGLLAVLVFLGLVVFIAWLTHDDSQTADGGESPEQVEWSVVLRDQTGATVTLKTDLPDGIVTETWEDEFMVARGPAGRFTWDSEALLPGPVVLIDRADGCSALNSELDIWVSEIATAVGDAVNLQARAFAQHALDRMRAEGCEIDQAMLQDVSG